MLMTRPRLVTWSRLLTWPSRSECLSYKSDDPRSTSGSLRTAQAGCHSLTHGSGNTFLCPNTYQHSMRKFSCFIKHSFILVNAYLVRMVYEFVCSVYVCESMCRMVSGNAHTMGVRRNFLRFFLELYPFVNPKARKVWIKRSVAIGLKVTYSWEGGHSSVPIGDNFHKEIWIQDVWT